MFFYNVHVDWDVIEAVNNFLRDEAAIRACQKLLDDIDDLEFKHFLDFRESETLNLYSVDDAKHYHLSERDVKILRPVDKLRPSTDNHKEDPGEEDNDSAPSSVLYFLR